MAQEERRVEQGGFVGRLVGFCLRQKVVVGLAVLVAIGAGVLVAPFDWEVAGVKRDPVAVDAIPDLSENQQIVFTAWPGRSPQDVEDQVTYPLTTALLGMAGVRTVRSTSMLGFSMVYVIFEDGVEFYWSRSRVLEKLSSLPAGMLPEGVAPTLGPDATALGQIFWYTLEGRDENEEVTGGWDLQELRTIQDWTVRYALTAVPGVSEVASVGGFVREYQVDVRPGAMREAGVTLEEVAAAVRGANREVGARTIEVNRVEYVVRGIGFVKEVEDLSSAVVKVVENVPVRVGDVAYVQEGPATRRGALDKEGAEAVGGVVVVRYGANPLAVIGRVKEKIAEISAGLPRKQLADGRKSQVTIVPFYDRTGLIHETLGTLSDALRQEVLVTIIVVLVMLGHLRSSALISGTLPLAVLLCFVIMKVTGVAANVVALTGIAIAIGTMVDMGIVLCENIVERLRERGEADRKATVHAASTEVGGAVLTAVATTIVGFLPVFTMGYAEGKLFRPLAFTKTFALFCSIVVALTVLPAAAELVMRRPRWWRKRARSAKENRFGWVSGLVIAVLVGVVLSRDWAPLGVEAGAVWNFVFVAVLLGGVLGLFWLVQRAYPRMLRWCLRHKVAFLSMPAALVLWGVLVWQGFGAVFGWLPERVLAWRPVSAVAHALPGMGKEFMPPLDEGAFLFMPTTMPHASIGEALEIVATQDKAISSLPEVESAVGKIGRVESALDPAPLSMIETVITYRPEFLETEAGEVRTFRWEGEKEDYFRNVAGEPVGARDGEVYVVAGKFVRDEEGRLIEENGGREFRLWRPALDPALNPGREAWEGIGSADDIWAEIVRVAAVPGTTSAPKLQPIAARLVMLQSGMRAPMGVKVKGPDLETIEQAGLEIEGYLKEVPLVNEASVYAERIVGKPYLEIRPNREAIARYGVSMAGVQEVIETAIGGRVVTTTVEGRERYAVRVRYPRELRDEIEPLGRILVAGKGGAQVPLEEVATIEYVRGPQAIKSEDGALVGYVLFEGVEGAAEVEVVEQARAYLDARLSEGQWRLAGGVSYAFAGTYESQVRAARTLRLVLPLTLVIIFVILYLHFGRTWVSMLVFSGVFVAWSGGFLMLWLYNQGWFLNFEVLGRSMREVFQVGPINLSVAVWVGFLALFGIATDDGVVMATYLEQSFANRQPEDRREVREAVVAAGKRRVRPCLMTTATTILALLPVLTSSGRGSDIMVPMAIPTFGGMVVATLTMFVVPVLYSWTAERWKREPQIGTD